MVKVIYLLRSEMLAVLLQVKVFYLVVILLAPLVALTVRMLVLIVMVSYLYRTANCFTPSDPIGRVTGSCVNGKIRLWRPYNNTGPTNEGIPLVCRSGVWKSVCSYSYSCYNAKLMCKAMGYPGALG